MKTLLKLKHIWKAYKANPTDTNLTALLKQMRPVIMKEVLKWRGSLSEQLLELEANKIAKSAFDAYDPAKTSLNTHLVNQLQRLSIGKLLSGMGRQFGNSRPPQWEPLPRDEFQKLLHHRGHARLRTCSYCI